MPDTRKEKILGQMHAHTGAKNQPIEVLLEVDGRRMQETARNIARHGFEVYPFKFVPYVAAYLNPQTISSLAQYCYPEPTDALYRRTITEGFERVRSIELPSAVRASPLLPSTNKHLARGEQLWNLENCGVYDAWNYATGRGARVGGIDSGIDYDHPEISSRFERLIGIDFVDGDDPMDRNGHGTHTAGTIAGKNVGAAPECTLYAIRVLDADGSGSEVTVMQGIEWAIEQQLDIVNMSLGSSSYTRAFEELVDYALNEGLIMVAAAGNEGGRYTSYPAGFEGVISVAAVDRNNDHAYFSNVNKMNDISAGGVNVRSCYPGNRYKDLSGTSMASPLVAGCIALGVQRASDPLPLERLMKDTAQEIGIGMSPGERQMTYGAGLMRADLMMQKILDEREGYAMRTPLRAMQR